jgi:protein gp37
MRCYAERQAYRAAAMGIERYIGLTKKVGDEIRWTGEVRVVEAALTLPLRWTRPRRIFVNSMSDLFHEKVTDEAIDRIFAVMALTPWHTYQILTKRPEQMHRYFTASNGDPGDLPGGRAKWGVWGQVEHAESWAGDRFNEEQWSLIEWPSQHVDWPLKNVWLGVSAEDQATADERIPLLLQTPAAVRWVSYEPALGLVDFRRWLGGRIPADLAIEDQAAMWGRDGIGWIVVGGESGPGARPFDLAWARSTVQQCRAASVPVFCKQLGARPIYNLGDGHRPEARVREIQLRDRKGADMAEWPEDLRVREFPA